jgi:hypothetical protein
VDPLCLKPALAQLFNNTLGELWLDSRLKDKVVVGVHNLECVGGIREARYRNIKSNKYDGVHLYGPSGRKAYTISVLDILKSADILDQTDGQMTSGKDYYSKHLQFQYQKRKHNGYYGYSKKPNLNRATPNSENDRDIRPQSYHRGQNTYEHMRYSVPTSNMFEHLNW